MQSLSHVQLFATPWTAAHKAPPSMEFSRQEHWSGLPFSFPGDLPDTGIEPGSPSLQVKDLLSEPPGNMINTKRERVCVRKEREREIIKKNDEKLKIGELMRRIVVERKELFLERYLYPNPWNLI